MTKKNIIVVLLIIIVIGLVCWYIVSVNKKESVGIANPAAVYCGEQGGHSEIVNNPDGSQGGICIFPDGSKCDEWAFFRKECAPGTK